MRAHPEPIGHYTPAPRSPILPTSYSAPTVLFVVPESDRTMYLGEPFTRIYTHDGAEAAKAIASTRPRAVVLDWDDAALGGPDVSAAARAVPTTCVLVTTVDVRQVPAILKAGCHGVLLKPFSPNLLAARLGRVIKETERPWGAKTLPPGWPVGTNRVWPETACPRCGMRGATSFDFSSYRRMWYACLSCDHTWLGPRQE
jgi:DNA-binding response OmpR family regulator